MTLEEMQKQAEKVVEALKAAGMEDVEYVSDHKPGDPLPIMYTTTDGEVFSLELTVA